MARCGPCEVTAGGGCRAPLGGLWLCRPRPFLHPVRRPFSQPPSPLPLVLHALSHPAGGDVVISVVSSSRMILWSYLRRQAGS